MHSPLFCFARAVFGDPAICSRPGAIRRRDLRPSPNLPASCPRTWPSRPAIPGSLSDCAAVCTVGLIGPVRRLLPPRVSVQRGVQCESLACLPVERGDCQLARRLCSDVHSQTHRPRSAAASAAGVCAAVHSASRSRACPSSGAIASSLGDCTAVCTVGLIGPVRRLLPPRVSVQHGAQCESLACLPVERGDCQLAQRLCSGVHSPDPRRCPWLSHCQHGQPGTWPCRLGRCRRLCRSLQGRRSGAGAGTRRSIGVPTPSFRVLPSRRARRPLSSSFPRRRVRTRCSSTPCASWPRARSTVTTSSRCRCRRSRPRCSRAPGTDESWARVDRKMLWSPAASSDRQRRRVLARVKARRYAPPPLRGAGNLDAGSAHALRLAPCLTMPNHDPYMLWSTTCPVSVSPKRPLTVHGAAFASVGLQGAALSVPSRLRVSHPHARLRG